MIEGRSMEHESPTDILHVALVSPPKNGKSRLFATAPGVKLDLDFDQRRQSIAGIKDVYAITLKDPQFPRMPEVADECLDIMSGLEKSLDLAELKDRKGNKMIPEAQPGTILKSLAFDSIQSMAKCCAAHEMYNNPDIRREISVGNGLNAIKIHIQKSFDAWNAETKLVESIIFRAFALPINVFCMFHETAEETADSTDKEPKYTGRVCVYPVRYKNILSNFNEVWRVKLTNVNTPAGIRYLPRVYPLPDYALDAATTMNLDPVEEPDIMRMIEKSKSRPKGVSSAAVQAKAIAGISQ